MSKNINFFNNALKSVAISLIFSIVCVMIFAGVLSIFSISTTAVKIVNCAIKILAVFIGCLFSIKGEKALLQGIIYGFLIILVNFIFYSIIGGSFSIKIAIIWEILLGVVVGVISSIIVVNLKYKN